MGTGSRTKSDSKSCLLKNEVEANDEAGHRAALLTVCGRDAYNLLRTLRGPKKPPEESYANLCKKMEERFNPKPSEVMQRFSFHSRMRRANETVIECVAALRGIAADCNFGNQLDENLVTGSYAALMTAQSKRGCSVNPTTI